MKRINEIINEIRESGFITEREILLIKSRCNRSQEDLWNYDMKPPAVSVEQGEKGLKWLRTTFYKKNGEPRKSCPFGERERQIIFNSEQCDFRFLGFYDCGRYGWHNFQPIYELGSMEYTVCGEILILS